MNLENEESNKCILEFPHKEKTPDVYTESDIKNYVLNSDIFIDHLIAWSTKQSNDENTISDITDKIEKFENTIQKQILTKITS